MINVLGIINLLQNPPCRLRGRFSGNENPHT